MGDLKACEGSASQREEEDGRGRRKQSVPSRTWEGTGDLKIWNLVRKREKQGSVNHVRWPPSKRGLELKTSVL